MSSFYGGKEGRTYHIVQRYDSVHDMVNAFSGGGAYTGANYGQYVIIDTVLNQGRSASKENGLLYRRGFDYNDPQHEKPVKTAEMSDDEFQQAWSDWVQNPGAGAIYVGQIVGPEGRTPNLTIQSWIDFIEQIQDDGNFGDKSQIDMIPTVTGKVRDSIKVGYVNIVDNHGDITGGYIAFDIPELVVEAEIVDHDAYSTAGVVEDGSSQNHPFWYKWNFTVPDGKHGQDFESIEIETGQQTGEEEDGFGNPIVNEDQYFTYSTRNYDENAAGAITEHLGRWPYRVINNITLDYSGFRPVIEWENNKPVRLGQLYRTEDYLEECYWICIQEGNIIVDPQIAIDEIPDITNLDQIGAIIDNLQYTKWRAVRIPSTAPAHSLYVDYTAGQNDQFEKRLRNLDYLSVDKDGNLYAFYSDLEGSYYLTNIGGLKSGTTDTERGIIVDNDSIDFIFTNGSVLSYPLKQILSIDFYVGNPQHDENNEWRYDSQGQLIFDDYTEDSNLRIRYKDGTILLFEIKRIDSINFKNTRLDQTQNFEVQYKGYSNPEIVNESPINTVTAIGRKGDNILVLYSDPNVRHNIDESHKIIIPSWTDPNTGIEYSNLEWYNFGQLGAQYHIQGQYTYADIQEGGDLENGFSGDLIDRAGWLITITDSQNNKHIYAYDYNGGTYTIGQPEDTFESSWYEVMNLQASNINPELSIMIRDTEPTGVLLDNMLWLVESYGHDNY